MNDDQPPQDGAAQVDALSVFAAVKNLPGAAKQAVPLPGDNRYNSVFATAVLALLKERGMYRRSKQGVMVDHECRRLEFFDGKVLTLYAEKHMDFVKTRRVKQLGDDGEEHTQIVHIKKSMTPAQGDLVLSQIKVEPGLINEIAKMNFCPMPVLSAEGKPVLLKPGYDAVTKTFTFDCGFSLDEGMTLPEAVGVFREDLVEFPFGDGQDNAERSLSVMIACMLTLFAQGLCPRESARPMFIFNANEVRSGKSLLAKYCTYAVFGHFNTSSWSEQKEEFRKSLETVAGAAEPYICYDNVTGYMANSDLEKFILSPWVTFRMMGKNTEQLSVPNVATVLVTSNNATMSKDIENRALFVNLYVTESDPQTRKIKNPLTAQRLSDPALRKRRLSALWALIRHWSGLKKEDVGASKYQLAGFEEWIEVIGGIVRAAGFWDPLTPKPAGMGNTSGQELHELVKVLWECEETMDGEKMFEPAEGGSAFKFAALCKVCAVKGLFDKYVPEEGEMKAADRSRFGKYLKKIIGPQGRTFVVEREGKATVKLVFRWNGEKDTRKSRFVVGMAAVPAA